MEWKDYVSPLLVFIAVLVGIFSAKKWDKTERGIKKLTPSGWITLLVGMVTLSIAFYAAYRNHVEKEKLSKENQQLKKSFGSEIVLGLDKLLAPYVSLYVPFNLDYIRSKVSSSVPGKEDMEASEKVKNAVPMDSLKAQRFVLYLQRFDSRKRSTVIGADRKQIGYDMEIYKNLSEGKDMLDKVLNESSCQLTSKEILALHGLATDTFLKLQIERFKVITDPSLTYRNHTQPVLSPGEETAYLSYLSKIENVTQVMVDQ